MKLLKFMSVGLLVAAAAASFTSCSKDKGEYTVKFINSSRDSYRIELRGNDVSYYKTKTLKANSNTGFAVEEGTYTWTATQQSGISGSAIRKTGSIVVDNYKTVSIP